MILMLNADIFPKNLLYLRTKRKLSQVKLAKEIGIGVHLLRGIERGHLHPQLTYTQYLSLCHILEVSPYLMSSQDLSALRDRQICSIGS